MPSGARELCRSVQHTKRNTSAIKSNRVRPLVRKANFKRSGNAVVIPHDGNIERRSANPDIPPSTPILGKSGGAVEIKAIVQLQSDAGVSQRAWRKRT